MLPVIMTLIQRGLPLIVRGLLKVGDSGCPRNREHDVPARRQQGVPKSGALLNLLAVCSLRDF